MEKLQSELTNEQRKYLGLIPVEKNWELVKLFDAYVYFDGDIIRKEIIFKDNGYMERELNEKTAENRTVLLPKTTKGKPKKLNFTGTQSFSPFGAYFRFSEDYISIANYDTQTTYFSEHFKEKMNFDDLKLWLGKWITETTEKDLKEIEEFKTAQRKHCKFKEGDFFAFKIGRRQFGFGRILIDIAKRKKTDNLKEGKNYGLTNIMTRPLVVKVYHKISNTPDIDLNELPKTMALPSQAVMDNHFYYGENFIIGHKTLEMEEYDMLISYGKSVVHKDPCVYLQYGFIYKDTDEPKFDKYMKVKNEHVYSGYSENPYRNEGVSYGVKIEQLQDCIAKKSNNPHWENGDYVTKYDLRNPANIEIKREIFKVLGLDADKNYEENLKLANS